MANTFRGYAQIAGISGTVTVGVVAWKLLKESVKLGHEFDEDIIKDEQGNDAAWRAYNEKDSGDVGMRFVDTSSPSLQANIETFCAALTPYATVVFTLFKPARFNGSYQLIPGSDYSLSNTTAGNSSLKLRKYTDPTQQALSVAVFTPS